MDAFFDELIFAGALLITCVVLGYLVVRGAIASIGDIGMSSFKGLTPGNGIEVFAVAIGILGFIVVVGGEDEFPVFEGLGPEAIGIALTIIVINRFYERRDRKRRKEQLIAQMSSRVSHAALEAIRVLAAEGWLQDGSLRGKDIWLHGIDGANLNCADMEGSNLGSSSITRATIVNANLRYADLGHVQVENSIIHDSDFEGATLEFAYIEKSSLFVLNMNGVNLRHSTLVDVHIGETTLWGADLRGADLGGCSFSNWDEEIPILKGALYDGETRWPDGCVPEKWGAVKVD